MVKWILLIVITMLVMVIFTGCGNAGYTKTEEGNQILPGTVENEQVASQTEQTKSIPVINMPEILEQDYAGVVKILGNPVKEEYEDTDTKFINYSLKEKDLEIEIKFFMDTPITISVTPLKEYKFTNDSGYSITEVPDDVMKLLADLGFNSPTGKNSSLAMRIFSYVDYGSPLREYAIQVSPEDWQAVDRGKMSKVRQVNIRLIDTR